MSLNLKKSLSFFFIVLPCLSSTKPALSQSFTLITPTPSPAPLSVPGEIIVKYKETAVDLDRAASLSQVNDFSFRFQLVDKGAIRSLNLKTFQTSNTDQSLTFQLVDRIKNDPLVEYAAPNYYRFLSSIPNDPHFLDQSLWALKNDGQTIRQKTGVANFDISALPAWQMESASQREIIVAVIDSGVAYDHPDLVSNMWDGSTCRDENNQPISGGCPYHGWDFANNDHDPYDDQGHGTHVAGIIAASSGNSLGITGISSQNKIKIMAIKASDNQGRLSDIAILKAINFAKNNGAKVINASFGGPGFSRQAYSDVLNGYSGLFIAAAGNDARNNEVNHVYPSDYDFDSVISVASIDNRGQLSSFSNFGAVSVDVGAPGSDILSTVIDYFEEDFTQYSPPSLGPFNPSPQSKWTTQLISGYVFLLTNPPNQPAPPQSTLTYSQTFDLSRLSSPGSLQAVVYCQGDINHNYLDLQAYDGSSWRSLGRLYRDDNGSFIQENIPVSGFSNSNFQVRLNWVTDSVDGQKFCALASLKLVFPGSNGQRYGYKQGTSMATPYTSGLAGLIYSFQPNLSVSQIRQVIFDSGDTVSSLAGKTQTGKKINLSRALTLVANFSPSPTPSPIISPAIPSPTATPSPSPLSPTPTQSPCLCPSGLAKNQGNADCNQSIDINDFSVWVSEYHQFQSTHIYPDSPRSDFNCDQNINLDDYEIWKTQILNIRRASSL